MLKMLDLFKVLELGNKFKKHPDFHATRDTWFQEATDLLRPLFIAAGASIPAKVRISVTVPTKGRTLGCNYYGEFLEDGINQIFIEAGESDPVQVLATLVHELIHACLKSSDKHGKAFKRIAIPVGLLGPMRSTTSSPELATVLGAIVKIIGPYPHCPLEASTGRKKQTVRNLKFGCEPCGVGPYRGSKKSLVGMDPETGEETNLAPLCRVCREQMELA